MVLVLLFFVVVVALRALWRFASAGTTALCRGHGWQFGIGVCKQKMYLTSYVRRLHVCPRHRVRDHCNSERMSHCRSSTPPHRRFPRWEDGRDGILALPDDAFETAGGNGHSRTSMLWFVANRPPPPPAAHGSSSDSSDTD